ncbi:MAG TPA: hypothetical protein EYN89_01685 [Flavobacteriales bacterium]|nr:hypothetical protein [Flavobacteriales bacterium]
MKSPGNKSNKRVHKHQKRIEELESENAILKEKLNRFSETKDTVKAPETFVPVFNKAQETVKEYFRNIDFNPSQGTITINDDRYVLIRASALSYDFFKVIKQLYRDEDENEAFNIGQNFLFDIGHLIGMEDAKQFHKKMNLKDPIEKLSAGPVHFAYSGWAFVDILPESRPTPDENYFLKYRHPYSFEADSWIKKGQKSDKPVCIMNAAYSSGWCEQSFDIELTAVEISCRAKGDKHCTFIMAPPDKIKEHLTASKLNVPKRPKIPVFFERKNIEKGLKKSLEEKEILLREIHHRVKNNLQIITSFLNLQFKNIEDKNVIDAILKSKSRINSMALIHTKLYQSDNLSSINFEEYINEIVQSITNCYVIDNNIKCIVKYSSAIFDIDLSINLGLIITELLTNACKHAFKEKRDGFVKIELTSMTNNKHQLIIEDNGPGLLQDIDMNNPKTLGLDIVVGLINQINGTIETNSNNGLKYVINFEN